MTIMPKKFNWDNMLNKAWLYTNIFFVSGIICAMAFSWGTFYPNKWSKQRVNSDLEIFRFILSKTFRVPKDFEIPSIFKNALFINQH